MTKGQQQNRYLQIKVKFSTRAPGGTIEDNSSSNDLDSSLNPPLNPSSILLPNPSFLPSSLPTHMLFLWAAAQVGPRQFSAPQCLLPLYAEPPLARQQRVERGREGTSLLNLVTPCVVDLPPSYLFWPAPPSDQNSNGSFVKRASSMVLGGREPFSPLVP